MNHPIQSENESYATLLHWYVSRFVERLRKLPPERWDWQIAIPAPSAHTLASLTTESDLAQGSLYPSLSRVREVSAHIAAGLAKTAHKHGMAKEKEPEDLLAQAHATMYDPHY